MEIDQLRKRDDLPEKLMRELRKIPMHEQMGIQITELFNEYQELNVDDVLVGLWRKYQRLTTRKTAQIRLQELCDEGVIKRLKLGQYRINNGK